MSQIFYKQSVNMKTNGWSVPMKTVDNAWQKPSSDCRWVRLKKSAWGIIPRIPFAINSIERWHKRKGHKIVRAVRVRGGYRTTYLMITIR